MTEHLVKANLLLLLRSVEFWQTCPGDFWGTTVFKNKKKKAQKTNKQKPNLISLLMFLLQVCSMKYFILVQGKEYPTIALICFQNAKIFLKGAYISFPGKCLPFLNKVPSAKDTSYSLN